ncbi:MAG TPA: hypothetical protein VKQ30_08100 [Ktedonobacterales bacterium]|nr:hypothetical protein [Ktedonobacterales bacterium]
MSFALILVLTYVLVPLFIGFVCLLARRDSGRAILIFSVSAIALSGIDVGVYFLEVWRIIPDIRPSPDYSLIDSFRAVCEGLGKYVGIAAWAFALFRTARSGRLGWMTAILVVAMISLVLTGIATDPYQFFSRRGYTGVDAVLLVAGSRLATVATLIYALVTRRDTVPAAPMPMMYPPMMYPPMMFAPPAPYGQPVSYAPPPPVVLPAPQPQPPTMTTPS